MLQAPLVYLYWPMACQMLFKEDMQSINLHHEILERGFIYIA